MKTRVVTGRITKRAGHPTTTMSIAPPYAPHPVTLLTRPLPPQPEPPASAPTR